MAKNPEALKLRRRLTLALLVAALGISASFAWSVRGCEGTASMKTTRVNIGGKNFTLEVAADNETRFKGLSQRHELDDDGGMIFAFRFAAVQRFVMRDCFMDIDIIYLDSLGTVVKTYTMKEEPPRGPGEGTVGQSNATYEARLVKYSSQKPAQFVIEIGPGLVDQLGVKVGDRIDIDAQALKRAAK